MRWLLAAVPLAFAAQAQAQTTFNAGDCSPYVAITNGGLTVTATLNPNNSNAVTCQANVGKYSGKWYYQRGPEHGRLEQRHRDRQPRLLGRQSDRQQHRPRHQHRRLRADPSRRRDPPGHLWAKRAAKIGKLYVTRRARRSVLQSIWIATRARFG